MYTDRCSVDSTDTTTSGHVSSLTLLLHELYDGLNPASHFGFDTESEEASNSFTSDHSLFRKGSVDADNFRKNKYVAEELKTWTIEELHRLERTLISETAIQNARLVKQLKRRDRELYRRQGRCNVVTAIVQAMSPKRSVDTKLQFTLEPPNTDTGYLQWLDAMRAVAKLPDGIPPHFRKKLWLNLADQYVLKHGISWPATCAMAFSDRITAEDDRLGMQIIKDLHRTGWSGLCGERERVLLKRVLLAYARYNPRNGYCQGFNVIAALILEVVEYKEEQALKVMMMLIETVLPEGYFDQTLRALSVDMAVLRELMHQRLPKLSAHLDSIQRISESEYEPPLTNVFSMQWFLTLFATCLPRTAVFRIWDSLVLEGSEILLRTALAIWARIARRVFRAHSADEFYSLMGPISQELLMMTETQCNDLLQVIYNLNEFPYPGVAEMRERYTWNIQPLSSNFRLLRTQVSQILSNEANTSDMDENASCITGFLLSSDGKLCGGGGTQQGKQKHVTDLNVLKKQYQHLTERQKQAAVIVQNAYARGQKHAATQFQRVDNMASPVFNHLYAAQSDNTCLKIPMLNGTIPLASKTVQPGARPAQPRRRTREDSEISTASMSTTTMPRHTLSKTFSIDTDHVFDDDLVLKSPENLLSASLDSLCDKTWTLPGSKPKRSQSDSAIFVERKNRILPRSLSCLEILLDGKVRQTPSPRRPRPPSLERDHRGQSRPVGHATRRTDRHDTRTHVTNETFDLSLMPSSVKQARPMGADSRHQSERDPETTTSNPYLMGYSVPPRPSGRSSTELMQRSKHMINSAPDPSTRPSKLPLNPFPVRHRSALIEREKRMGLRTK